MWEERHCRGFIFELPCKYFLLCKVSLDTQFRDQVQRGDRGSAFKGWEKPMWLALNDTSHWHTHWHWMILVSLNSTMSNLSCATSLSPQKCPPPCPAHTVHVSTWLCSVLCLLVHENRAFLCVPKSLFGFLGLESGKWKLFSNRGSYSFESHTLICFKWTKHCKYEVSVLDR